MKDALPRGLYDSVVITGGGGMLARALNYQFSSRGLPCATLSRAQCDVTRPEQVREVFERYRPSLVLNCAAHTRLDQAEDEPEAAQAINGDAMGTISVRAREFNTRLVHFSTDAVFHGTANRPYRPEDPVSPISVYGRSKLLGEILLKHADPPDWLIIRTAWLFGNGRCFPATVVRTARAGQPLRVVSDQIGSPTYSVDLAQATLGLLDRAATGVWNVTNCGSASWNDIAREVTGEQEFGQIVTATGQWVRAERALADVLQIRAVMNPVAPNTNKQDIRVLLVDALGHVHENVEPAHHLKAACDIGDDLGAGGNGQSISTFPTGIGMAVEHVHVHAVEDHLDLVLELLGERCPLVARGCPALIAIVQVQKDHGIAGSRLQQVELRDWKFFAIAQVSADDAIEELQKVDDRSIVEVGKKQRRSKSRMGHDQVGLDVRAGFERFVDAVGLAHGFLEIARADVIGNTGLTGHT